MKSALCFWLTGLFLLAALVLGPPSSKANGFLDFDGVVEKVGRAVSGIRDTASPLSAPEVRGGPAAVVPEDQFERRIVLFSKHVPYELRRTILRQAGLVPVRDLWLIDGVAVTAPKKSMPRSVEALAARPEVRRVDRDDIQKWLLADADPGQMIPWGVRRVHAPAAWETTRGDGVKVAVVDTGIDHRHAELNVEGGFNAYDNAAPWTDDHGHGTHVAGTIAVLDDDGGLVGVAPKVRLFGVKVISKEGYGSYSDIIEGLQWCVAAKMDVVNMSLGAPKTVSALDEAVRAADAAGVVIVAASGNSGQTVVYPAAYPQTIAVAASDINDKVADFSSRGPEVDLVAPGVSIRSTAMGGGYSWKTGTSMASPHVAGLAALAIGAHGLRGVRAVRKALKEAAEMLPDASAEMQGAGMVDAAKLVAQTEKAGAL
ncbi:MAG: S8 family peptidase [Elusimicrobiota bacterium]